MHSRSRPNLICILVGDQDTLRLRLHLLRSFKLGGGGELLSSVPKSFSLLYSLSITFPSLPLACVSFACFSSCWIRSAGLHMDFRNFSSPFTRQWFKSWGINIEKQDFLLTN